MNRLVWLLAVAVVGIARMACCWAAAPEAAAGTPQAARLPPVPAPAATAGAPARPLAEETVAASDVSLTSYQDYDYVVEEELEPVPVKVDPNATRLYESTWYTRVDYFYWEEKADGALFMQNNGAVTTLGYQHRHRRQRVRAELFGGQVDYFADLGGLDDSNVTDYLGLRGEYELMFEPQLWPGQSLFAGIGSRFFVRSTPDILLPGGVLVDGYQEAWWTFYPYIGAETRRTLRPGWEAYYRARIGVTALTWEHVSLNDVTLFPQANVTVQGELGFRGPRWHLGAYTEIWTWSPSPEVLAYDGTFLYQVNQPASTNIEVGLKTGFSH